MSDEEIKIEGAEEVPAVEENIEAPVEEVTPEVAPEVTE